MIFGHKLHQEVAVNMGGFNLELDPPGDPQWEHRTPIYVPQAGYPGFARGRTLQLFRVHKLINIFRIPVLGNKE